MKLHELCELFPKIEGEEFDKLVESIRANGLNNPIITLDGQILDGGNRYRACLEAGIEPGFVEFHGGDPVEFVCAQNIDRRHLSAGQRAMIAAGLATRKQGFQEEGAHGQVPTVEEAAKVTKASVRNTLRARKIKQTSPKLASQVTNGSVSIRAAGTVAGLSKKKRNKAIDAGAEGVKAAAAKAAENKRRKRDEAKRGKAEEKARIKSEKAEAKKAKRNPETKATSKSPARGGLAAMLNQSKSGNGQAVCKDKKCRNGVIMVDIILPIVGTVDQVSSHDCPKCRPGGDHAPLTVEQLYNTTAWKSAFQNAEDFHRK